MGSVQEVYSSSTLKKMDAPNSDNINPATKAMWSLMRYVRKRFKLGMNCIFTRKNNIRPKHSIPKHRYL